MSAIVYEAMMFARETFKSRPLFVMQLGEIVGLVASVPSAFGVVLPQALASAWLHRAIDEGGVHRGKLFDLFGYEVTSACLAMADTADDGSTPNERLAVAPDWVQSIMCAQMVAGFPLVKRAVEAGEADAAFLDLLRAKSVDRLDVMMKADARLWVLARAVLT